MYANAAKRDHASTVANTTGSVAAHEDDVVRPAPATLVEMSCPLHNAKPAPETRSAGKDRESDFKAWAEARPTELPLGSLAV